jgi:hypothetical protein
MKSNLPAKIKNFDKFIELLNRSNENPENLGYIHDMMALDGFNEWYDWMKKHRPNDLP